MQTEIKNEWIYEQSPNEVWEYLTQPELIALWLMPNNFKPIVGHSFQFQIKPIPALDLDGIFHCTVLELIPMKKLSYSWKGGPGHGVFTLDTICEWVLEPFGNGTKLFLKHTGFKEANFAIFTGMTDGWQKNIQKMITHLDGSRKPSGKMKIGIIGAGQIGASLIRQYASAGHHIKMTNATGLEKLKKLEAETGARAVTLADAAIDIGVLIIAIPLIAIPNLSKTIGQGISANTVVIDTTNYYPIRDGRIDEIENGMPESIWVSNHLQRPVVKVYNSIIAGSLAQSGHDQCSATRIALPVSGDDQQSKSLVARLVNDSGFDALDIGNLQESWRQQPGSPVYCTDLNLPQLTKNIAKANKELLAERRELSLQFILKQNPAQWMDWWRDCVINNRSVNETDVSA